MAHRRRLPPWTTALLLTCCRTDAASASTIGERDADDGNPRRPRRLRRRPARLPIDDLGRRPDEDALADGRHPTYRRLVSSSGGGSSSECDEGEERPFVLTFQTDSYGRETSWFLRRASDSNAANDHGAAYDDGYVGWGPPAGVRYGDFTIYSFAYCLAIGSTYVLAVEDDFGDGMCCARGYGGYEYSLGGRTMYGTDLMATFREYAEHTFTVREGYDDDDGDDGDDDDDYDDDEVEEEGPTEIQESPTEVQESLTLPVPGSGPTTGRPTGSPPTLPPSTPPTKSPSPLPTPFPTPRPTPGRDVLNPSNGCYGGDVRIRVESRSDKYFTDTSYDLIDPDGNLVLHHPPGNFTAELQDKVEEACVSHGNHTFVIRDEYGDGMCCRYGQGFFKVTLDGREVLNGGSFNDQVNVILNVGFDPDGHMTERERGYLEAHNVRRREWHARHNVSYVPLTYSPALATDARLWAEELLHSCGVVGIEHEDQNSFGENLAKNVGSPNTWGRLYPPDNIVGRWVDFEVGLPYPSNGHLTQALWRASKYLGCGESVRTFRNGVCRVQVCRYGRAGNCDMKKFNATYGENWLVPMLLNHTRCGPDCPQEGCF